MGAGSFRIFLTGQVAIEIGDWRVDERAFGGRQVRQMLAYLIVERARPVHQEDLAEMLWPYRLPPTWAPALRALISKTRALLIHAGLTATDGITQSLGCYQAHLPNTAVIDTDLATSAVDEAEQALREDDADQAGRSALAARAVVAQPFLPGDEGPWIERQRTRLQTLLLRTWQALSESYLRRGQFELALAVAEEALSVAPVRDSTHRQVMRAHAADGDRCEALRAYERYRRLTRDELGVGPSPAMETLYLDLLRGQ